MHRRSRLQPSGSQLRCIDHPGLCCGREAGGADSPRSAGARSSRRERSTSCFGTHYCTKITSCGWIRETHKLTRTLKGWPALIVYEPMIQGGLVHYYIYYCTRIPEQCEREQGERSSRTRGMQKPGLPPFPGPAHVSGSAVCSIHHITLSIGNSKRDRAGDGRGSSGIDEAALIGSRVYISAGVCADAAHHLL